METLHVVGSILENRKTKWQKLSFNYLKTSLQRNRRKIRRWCLPLIASRRSINVFQELTPYFLFKQKRKTEETKKFIVTAVAKLTNLNSGICKMHRVYPTSGELSSIEVQKNGNMKTYSNF